MRSVHSEPKLYPVNLDISKKWFISYKDIDGKEQKVYGRMAHRHSMEERLNEANILLSELKTEWLKNKANSFNGTLLKDMEFAIETRKQGKKLKTKQGYDLKFKVFAEWYRKTNYPAMNEMAGISFMNWLSKQHSIHSNTTINNYRRLLKTVFTDLVKFKVMKENPFDLTKKLPQRSTTKKWFTREMQSQLKRMMLETGNLQLWICCMIQYYCFIRPGDEMRSLRIGNIIVDGDKWKFNLYGQSLKTVNKRHVIIPDELRSLLEPYIKGFTEQDYIFSKEGTPGKTQVGQNYFYNKHRLFMQAMNLPEGYTLYSWKNTGAVMMYKEGVKMKYISLLMGHSSIEVTDEYFKSMGIDDVMDDVQINYPTIK
jgi:integrase